MKTKTYGTEAAAKAAIKKRGIAGVPHMIEKRLAPIGARDKWTYVPVFNPELAEDRVELRSRGWEVK